MSEVPPYGPEHGSASEQKEPSKSCGLLTPQALENESDLGFDSIWIQFDLIWYGPLLHFHSLSSLELSDTQVEPYIRALLYPQGKIKKKYGIEDERKVKPWTLHPAPYTLHPTPSTLHPTPSTLHPTPYTLHPNPYTLHPKT